MSIQPNFRSTFRRVLLALLSLFSLIFIAQSLFSTVDQPQAPSLVDLLQTDLSLQASAWKTEDQNWSGLSEIILEKDSTKAYQQALESYQEALQSNLRELGIESKSDANYTQRLDTKINKADEQFLLNSAKKTSLNELDLRIGILQALAESEAEKTWNQIITRSPDGDLAETAKVLRELWYKPSQVLPNAEAKIKENLDRWAESFALEKLYQQQKRSPELKKVLIQRQSDAYAAIERIVKASAVPLVGSLIGLLLWIGLLTQRLFWSSGAILKLGDRGQNSSAITWGAEKTWEVMVIWFSSYVVISNLLPFLLLLINSTVSKFELQLSPEIFQSIAGVFVPYCLTMLPMLPIIYWSLPQSSALSSNQLPTQLPAQSSANLRPESQNWLNLSFKPGRWILWGIGGYFAAVPLVLIASTLSEKIWYGQGGSNPLLPILTESQDSLAKFIFWVTLAIAAPFFEEYLFRGFFFSSLTKLMPIPFALILSGFCFAIVHLNLGDIIPLTVLGIVLGFVYHKSRNLLAPILLHCLWNSASFISLLALGS